MINKDRQNNKRHITYWLDHNHLGWLADIVRKTKVPKIKVEIKK